MIKHTQKMLFQGHKTCVDKNTGVTLPDYKKVAKAFEIPYYTEEQMDHFINDPGCGIMEVFMDGLKYLFSDHYISVPEDKVDVLEALAEKVSALEEKLDETISENAALKGTLIEDQARDIFEELASDLALTQQEKFAALAEGIEFDGNLNTYAKKLNIIKENYFHNDSATYSSNIEEETFEGEISETTRYVDPQVNRYVQAIARNVKK
jgi:hypothetical protein